MFKTIVPGQRFSAFALVCTVALACWLWLMPSAIAGLDDDRYDGNIFALYAGNGSLVPP
ncbi:MAG: thioredoxin family protein, partial [Cyanobacteria bacterium]|nr:thioredoxin family protein [Cyanobacteria bacterium GSL.Bin21]